MAKQLSGRTGRPEARGHPGGKAQPGVHEGQDAIRQLMQTEVYRVDADASANDAAQLMWEKDIGSVPVVEADNTLIGIVTDRDIAMAAYIRGKAPAEIPIRSLLTKEIISAHADDSIHAVSDLMSRRQVRRVPIVDDGNKLVGIVSLNDLAIAATEATANGGITEHDVADTLRAICATRSHAGLELSAN